VKQNDYLAWCCASDCLWSEADTTDLKSSLKHCYPDLKDFFLIKLSIFRSEYDLLLYETSDDPDLMKESVLAFMGEVGESIPSFPAKPMQTAKILPVRHPDGTVLLCSVDTEFAIADREHFRKELKDKVKILDFDLEEVRYLWPFFEWLEIADRHLSRCVEESVAISPDGCSLLDESESWDLRRKAYHITR
jgi:hypothetical protein